MRYLQRVYNEIISAFKVLQTYIKEWGVFFVVVVFVVCFSFLFVLGFFVCVFMHAISHWFCQLLISCTFSLRFVYKAYTLN